LISNSKLKLLKLIFNSSMKCLLHFSLLLIVSLLLPAVLAKD
jgi:hypothetical protein